MKFGKRFAALLVMAAFVVMMLPAAAMADNTNTPITIKSCDSYVIGKLTPEASSASSSSNTIIFTPQQSVALYDSDLTLRIFFTSDTRPSQDYTESVTIKQCNFEAQDARAKFYKDCLYVDIVGLKYTNDNDNDFRMTLPEYKNGSEDIFLQIGEATRAEPEATATPEPSAQPTATPDPRAPGLIIKSSSVGNEAINAGDDFTLSLTVYATSSGNEAVQDVLVSIAPDKGIVVASGSSTQYIGTMQPGTAQTVSFPMKALSDFTEGVSTVAVTLAGASASTGTAANATGTTISVPISQPDRFAVSKVEVPESIMVGEEQMATITFVNMGKNPINNLTFDFACDNCQESSQNQYVGNLAAGTEDSVDFDLNPVQAGQLSGTVTISYEGTNGQPVTLTQEITAAVEDMGMEDSGMMDPGDMPVDAPVQQGLPSWAVILIVVAAAAAVVIVIVVLRRRKAKKQKALEAEEDEDL